MENLQQKLALLADAAEEHIDWPRLLALCEKEPPALPEKAPQPPARVRIAVAQDEAFCFTYAETLEAFRDAGAEVVFFSPLRDTALPENIGGLYLPGGYPELHARELSENTSLLREIKQKIESGLPTAAECGGFLYLGQSLTDAEGQSWPMAGVLPGEAKDAGRLLSLFSVSSATEPDIAIILLITYYVNMFFLAKSCFHPVILIFYLLCHCFFDSTKQFVIGLIGRNMGILCFDLIRASE